MPDSPATGSVTYQTATLTQGLADTLLRDNSPQTVLSEIWEFLNTALMTANLSYIDFLNIMDFVDLRFANMLMGIPEDEWVDFRVYENLWDTDPNDPTKRVIVKTKEYPITELWDAVRAKVYIKCCNSRGGHLIKTLTEQRISQSYSESGVVRPEMNPLGQPPAQGSGWRAI